MEDISTQNSPDPGVDNLPRPSPQIFNDFVKAAKTLVSHGDFDFVSEHLDAVDKLSNALSAHKVVVSDLVEERKANQGKIEQLTQSTKQLEDDNSVLRQETSKLQESSLTQKETIKKAIRKVKELESHMKDQKTEIAGLREAESTANHAAEVVRSELQLLQAEYNSLAEDAGQLKGRLAAFEAFTSRLSDMEVETM